MTGKNRLLDCILNTLVAVGSTSCSCCLLARVSQATPIMRAGLAMIQI